MKKIIQIGIGGGIIAYVMANKNVNRNTINRNRNRKKQNPILKLTKDDFVIGHKNAPVTIIEYSSLSCGHCADYHNTTLNVLINEYVNKNKVKIVFRAYPLSNISLLASMLVLNISDIDKRLEYMNYLYKTHREWSRSKRPKKVLIESYGNIGLTEEDFNECYNNKELESKIKKKKKVAENELNVRSTPSFYINGELLRGNQPIENFRRIIDSKLI